MGLEKSICWQVVKGRFTAQLPRVCAALVREISQALGWQRVGESLAGEAVRREIRVCCPVSWRAGACPPCSSRARPGPAAEQGDRTAARRRLGAAAEAFRALAMPSWLARAQAVLDRSG
jgi:hypothetical protein